MKKEILTSFLLLGSINSSYLHAQDFEKVVLEVNEENKETYETLKALSVLKSIRVDRDANKFKVNTTLLPSLLLEQIEENSPNLVDRENNEVTIDEIVMDSLNKSQYVRQLKRAINPTIKLEPTYNNFLEQINKRDIFDLREDLNQYSSAMFS